MKRPTIEEHVLVMMDSYNNLPNKKKETLKQFFKYHMKIAEGRGSAKFAETVNEMLIKTLGAPKKE